jgi:hypothetical protein
VIPPDTTKCPTHGDLRVSHCPDCDRLRAGESIAPTHDRDGKWLKKTLVEWADFFRLFRAKDLTSARCSDLERKLRAAAAADERFDCGHRKVDWNDSYGKCALCPLIKQAHECDAHHDLTPLMVVLGYGVDDEAWPPGETAIEAAARRIDRLKTLAISDYGLTLAAQHAAETIRRRIALNLERFFGQPVEITEKGLEDLIMTSMKGARGKEDLT